MNKPDLRPWDDELEEEERAQALAAAGVLYGHLRYYPFEEDDPAWLHARLQEALTGPEATVAWLDPELTSPRVRHTSPAALAAAWQRLIQGRARVVLEVMGAPTDYALWYLSVLRHAVGRTGSVYLGHAPQDFPLDWEWPLTIGFAHDPATEVAERRLRDLLDRERWLQPVARLVDVPGGSAPVDFLVFPRGPDMMQTLLEAAAPVRAHCNILCGLDEEGQEKMLPLTEKLWELTLASGTILSAFDPAAPETWLAPLARELSHNRHLGDALAAVPAAGPPTEPPAVLVASRDLLRAAQVSTAATSVAEKLSSLGPHKIQIDTAVGGHLGLPSGVHDALSLGNQLRLNVPHFHFLAESEEATTVSKLSQASSSAAKERPSPPLQERFLQYQLEHDAMTSHGIPELAFFADTDYALQIRIGPVEGAWKGADRAFSEESLPRGSGGHLLTVVFSEPEVVPIPQLSAIFLPAGGSSTSCRFAFHVGSEVKTFRGRVVVMHENRVLQTALLEGRVSRRGGRGHAVSFTIESVVIRDLGGLASRQRYSAAIVVNQSAKGGKRALCVRGYAAALINLEEVKEAIESIRKTLDKSPWEDMERCTLKSGRVLELLRKLATPGRLLYDALLDQRFPESLQEADRIQLVAASAEAAHLPVEFCYMREPPAANAPLCERLRSSLTAGSGFPWEDCRTDCPVVDDESAAICPWAFWALNRVIEWHRFDPTRRIRIRGADYAITSERTTDRPELSPLRQILLAASQKVKPGAKDVGQALAAAGKAPLEVAGTWSEWARKVGKLKPTLLVLLVHTEDVDDVPTMEINGKLLDPPYIRGKMVGTGAEDSPPVVLLLGCGTGMADVGFFGFTTQFRRKGAAIVVSSIAELLDVHAPLLAQRIVEELASSPTHKRTFGDVMLAVRRSCVLSGQPIGMALVSYGDADWEV